MKRVMIASLGLWLLPAALSFADDACVNPKTSYDSTYCVAKLFFESDKELNDVYKDLTKAIKESEKKKLVEAQRAWIKFRNNACESFGTINVKCNYEVNKNRTEFLRDRLRECKTGNCRNDLLAKQDWKAPTHG